MGYKAELNYGTGKCKIDIAVRNKNNSEFLIGILFDESVYINSDDFIGRESIINGLEKIGNWKLLRIYTVDWFENPAKQLDIVTSALKGDNFEGIFSDSNE